MPWWLRSLPVRVGTILLYCCGAVVAPSLHYAFHRNDHIHVGDSIVYLPEDDRAEENEAVHGHSEAAEAEEHEHDVDGDDDHDHDHDHHHHHHHHHHDSDHGGSSIWHFGAALSDHIDRTPVLAAASLVGIIERSERPRAHSLLTARTPRLRGPPRLLPA